MAEENIRIYGREEASFDPVFAEGERAAEEYRAQKENGNLQKAHELGCAVADCFLCMEVGQEHAAQKYVLLSYLAQNLLEEELPNPLLQKSAQGKFNSTIVQNASQIGQIIHDSKAFTLYALNENRLRSRSEGEIFAELCEHPQDRELIAEGEALAQQFAEKVLAAIRGVRFSD